MCVQWKGLLPQLFAMDQGLDDMHEHEPNKGSQNVAVYHNTDQFCAGTHIIQYSVHGNYVHSTLAKHSIEMQLVGIVMQYCTYTLMCMYTVDCQKALYKFRHAIRFTHLEFKKNPELCQVSLLK